MQLLSFGRVKHVKVKSQKWMVLMSLAGTESHIVWLCLFFLVKEDRRVAIGRSRSSQGDIKSAE